MNAASIEEGKRADLVAIDANGEVQLTVIGGEIVPPHILTESVRAYYRLLPGKMTGKTRSASAYLLLVTPLAQIETRRNLTNFINYGSNQATGFLR
jgi:hypothetical protein